MATSALVGELAGEAAGEAAEGVERNGFAASCVSFSLARTMNRRAATTDRDRPCKAGHGEHREEDASIMVQVVIVGSH